MADDNVVYGVDFKAVADRVDAKLDHIGREIKDCINILHAKGWHADTTPCDYVAPNDDCA